MVIDTSAILAVLLREPDAGMFRLAITRDPLRLMSAVSALEATCVLESRRGLRAGLEFELVVHKINIRVMAFDLNQLDIARDAWRRFGRGRHPASLNFGDCAAYALTKATGEPLLFKGRDFSLTDVASVRLA